MMSGVAIRRLTLTKLNQAQIPLPPIQTRRKLSRTSKPSNRFVAANRELIERFEKKIQATARVLGSEKVTEGR